MSNTNEKRSIWVLILKRGTVTRGWWKSFELTCIALLSEGQQPLVCIPLTAHHLIVTGQKSFQQNVPDFCLTKIYRGRRSAKQPSTSEAFATPQILPPKLSNHLVARGMPNMWDRFVQWEMFCQLFVFQGREQSIDEVSENVTPQQTHLGVEMFWHLPVHLKWENMSDPPPNK